jgi:hypothetical protein
MAQWREGWIGLPPRGVMEDCVRQLNEIAAWMEPERAVAVGNWFGKPCLKVQGKIFAALWQGDMAFKLSGEAHAEALQVEGAHLFDPRGKGHPMKRWVQIPAKDSARWSHFARLACDYVAGAAQAEKDGIIGGLQAAREKILDAVRLLTPAQQDEVFLGEWSVKDLLAHLVGWDYTNREAVGRSWQAKSPASGPTTTGTGRATMPGWWRSTCARISHG